MAGCFPRHLCCRPAAVNAARCCHNVPHQTRAEHQNKNTHRRPYQPYDPPHIDSDHRYTQQQGSATRHPASARHPQAPRCRHQCPNNAYTHQPASSCGPAAPRIPASLLQRCSTYSCLLCRSIQALCHAPAASLLLAPRRRAWRWLLVVAVPGVAVLPHALVRLARLVLEVHQLGDDCLGGRVAHLRLFSSNGGGSRGSGVSISSSDASPSACK